MRPYNILEVFILSMKNVKRWENEWTKYGKNG